jgi:O-antigen/teichoic acid export membrane protein
LNYFKNTANDYSLSSFCSRVAQFGRKLLKHAFKKLSLIEITSKCVSFAVTISLAYLFRDYWALIWGNVSAVITTVFVSYFIAPKTPSLTLKHIKEQWHFTKGIFLSSVLGYLRAKADIFIVSKKFGSESVGHYSIAQEFSSLPLTEVISPMMSPLFSSFAKIADQQQLLEEKVFKYLSLTYLFLFPCVTGMVFLSAEIVEILLGKQWSSAAPVLANLSFLMVVFITNGTLKHIFTLRSLFKGVIIIDILGLILIACALLIDHIDAIASFSQYRAFIGIIIIISTAIIAKIMLRFKLLPFLIISIVPFGCSFLMWCALSISSVYTEILMNLYLETLALIFIGAISYLALAYSAIHLLKNKSTIWHFNHSFVTSSMMSITKKLKNVIK